MRDHAAFVLTASMALLVALGACDKLKRKSDGEDRAATEAKTGATADAPRTSKPAATVVSSSAGYAVGDAVLVEWRGSWYKASILEVRGAEPALLRAASAALPELRTAAVLAEMGPILALPIEWLGPSGGAR